MEKYFAPEMALVEYETDDIMTASADFPGIEDATDSI